MHTLIEYILVLQLRLSHPVPELSRLVVVVPFVATYVLVKELRGAWVLVAVYRSLLEPIRTSNPYATYLEASCDRIDSDKKVQQYYALQQS